MVLKLDVWTKGAENGNVVRRKASITSAQNSTIKIEDKSFILQSSVHLVSNKSACFSYASIIRINNKWVHVNNHVLYHEFWPKGAKNLYLAFYEQVALSSANLNRQYHMQCHLHLMMIKDLVSKSLVLLRVHLL